jgi:phage terminase large subunit-like protein
MATIDDIVAALRAQPGFDPARFDPAVMVEHLSDEAVGAMLAGIIADEERARFNRFRDLFPDEGPLRRELYQRHMEFFEVGRTFRERCFLAANRVGKTVGAGYETTCHLTGLYPPWWPGRRFRKPIRAWVAGATNETTRDIIQTELLGDVGYADGRKTVDGSGIIPRETIGDPIWKSGVQNLVDTIPIWHVSGGWSQLGLKSYEQGRKAFEGTAKELIWLDEEVDISVYGECLIRTATTKGILILTFTPLKGLSETVLQFLPAEMRPGA